MKMVEKRIMSFVKDLLILMERERINVSISAHNTSRRPLRRYFENLTIKQMMGLENPYHKFFEYTIKC